MKTEHYSLELLTRCFLGGANPRTAAELRASSIRGQLRWWFRTLGGFNALAPDDVRKQEDEIFGVAADGSGTAGRLRLQILQSRQLKSEVIGKPEVDALPDEKYLLWPFAQERDGQPNPRACLPADAKFQLRVHWLGDLALWPSIRALIEVFGSLGALGTRSRRAMGALGFTAGALPCLARAFSHFQQPTGVVIRQLNAAGYPSSDSAKSALAGWLRGWREHGRSSTHQPPPNDPKNPGFDYALRDHDEGVVALGRPRPSAPSSGHAPYGANGESMRAVLGLPLAQRFGGSSVRWSFDAAGKHSRFASPVILRPYRVTHSLWRALVIFVDAHQWPDDPGTGKPKPVYLNGSVRAVSRDLYDEMKRRTPTHFP